MRLDLEPDAVTVFGRPDGAHFLPAVAGNHRFAALPARDSPGTASAQWPCSRARRLAAGRSGGDFAGLPHNPLGRQTYGNGGAGALDAGDFQAAAVQHHQGLGKWEAKAGAGVFLADRTVDLAERLERGLDLLGRHADAGVGDREAETRYRVERDRDFDLAGLGEFDRIRHQVDQDLA